MSDTSQPQFWDERYAGDQTPWDFGGAPVALREFLAREKPGKVLIPGCGRGQNAPFDLIYERTFLCALPPAMRPAYAGQVARCLCRGGRLAGFFFIGTEPDSPPNPLAPGELAQLLGGKFALIEDIPATDSLPIFVDRE